MAVESLTKGASAGSEASETNAPLKPPPFGIFGSYRFLLALLVMMTHTGPRAYEFVGCYAVFAFYVLSGYVVSYILVHSYLPKHGGIAKYFLNRALRIYPPYWVVCLLFACFLYFYPEKPGDILQCSFPTGKSIGMEAGWWVLVLSLLGTAIPFIRISPRPLIPIATSVGVEIYFWMLMPFALQHRFFRNVMLAFAVGYTIFTTWLTFHLGSQTDLFALLLLRYFSAFAGALPFCIGMMIVLRKSRFPIRVPHALGVAAIAVFAIHIFTVRKFFHDPYFFAAYASLIINTLIICYLSQFSSRDLHPAAVKIDRYLGYLSYPLFLIHLPVAVMLHTVFPLLTLHSMPFFLLTLLTCVPPATLLHYGVEVPMDRFRNAVKC